MANNKTKVINYAKSIICENKIACKELKQTCKRFIANLDNPLYEFKYNNADFVIHIIENTFVHIKGDLTNKPFLLEDWEKFICYNIAGFYYKDTQERLYKEAFIFIPRKNGKTPFASSLAWALALLDRKYTSTLYIIANKLDRALESFDIIKKNIELMGIVDEFRILNNNAEHSISRTFFDDNEEKVGEIKIQALASDAKRADGLNANIIILDEIHAYKNANEYFVYKQAMKAYTNKLLIGITTAGTNINSFCYQRLIYCQKILDSVVQDEEYFIFICKADNADDYLNPIEHEKANPNYTITIRAKDIIGEAMQALNDPSSRSEFLNKSLNIYTNVATSYFDINEVQTSDSNYTYTIDELLKLPIIWVGGADLSVKYDLTAACIYGEYNGVGITITHGFIPLLQAHKKAEEDDIPFIWWEEQKWLTLCSGDVIDDDQIVKWFKDMKKRGFKIKSVAFDKYKSRGFVKMMKASGFKLENSDQAYWKKSEAFRYIENKIKEKKFTYLQSKAFEYCISNVQAVEDYDERIRYEKTDEHSRMDLFDCTVIAVKQWIIEQDKSNKLTTWFG